MNITKGQTMTQFTYDDRLISDLHKDCWGTRPSVYYMSTWKAMTPEQKQEEWDYMCNHVEENLRQEEEVEQKAYDAWNESISNIADTAGVSRAEAIRYDMGIKNAPYDIGYYCYQLGLSYTRESEIARLLNG